MRKILYAAIALIIAAASLLSFAAPAKAAGENLLQNPGFEDTDENGFPSGWYWEGWYTNVDECIVGADREKAYSGEGSGYVKCIVPDDARFVQTVSVKPDTVYKLSGYILAKDCVQGSTGAWLTVLDIFDGSRSMYNTQDKWVYTEVYGRTGDDQTELSVCARIGGYGSLNSGEAWFDDLSLTEENAPAGAAVIDFFREKASPADEGTEEEKPDYSVPAYIWTTVVCIAFAAMFAWFFISGTSGRQGIRKSGVDSRTVLWLSLAVILLIKMIAAVIIYGYKTDMACFKGWSIRMAEVGPFNFYTNPDYFCDYPPGYMYVLWAIGGIYKLFGLSYGSAIFTLLVKMPAIISDIGIAYMVYKLSRRHMEQGSAVSLAVLTALCPASLINSSAWGQMDSVMVLFLLLAMHFFLQKKHWLTGVFYMLAVMFKPLSLVFGPVILLCYLMPFFKKDEDKKAAFISMCKALAAGLGVMVVLVVPFGVKMSNPLWIIEKYVGTLGSYGYASLNAYNVFTMLGANWLKQTLPFMGLNYQIWGYIGMALTFVFVVYIALRRRNPRDIYILSALIVSGFYILGPRMHERYLYPALFMLIFAFITTRDKRLLYVFGVWSISQAYNYVMAMLVTHVPRDNAFMIILSVINVAAFAYFVWIVWSRSSLGETRANEKYAFVGWKPMKAAKPEAPVNREYDRLILSRGEKHPRFTWLDYVLMTAVTVVYGAVALINLGDAHAAETYWRPTVRNEEHVADMQREYEISEIKYFCSIGQGTISFLVSDDGYSWTNIYSIAEENKEMYAWHFDAAGKTALDEAGLEYRAPVKARYLKIKVEVVGMRLLEVGLYDVNGDRVPCETFAFEPATKSYTEDSPVSLLFDEQQELPENPSYMNSMYFDEIYHARTAYEHLNYWSPYEITHPPLGKIIIGLGIRAFGMNPFGWRIMGTICGIVMLPVMYLLAHLVLKKTKWAFAATALMAVDFMHYVQTRIATIDSYSVLFIMLMYYFMYRYTMGSFYHKSLWKGFIPLGLSGICFGLGAATKWICLYAGAGLAILFFHSLYQRLREYLYAKREVASASGEEAGVYRRVIKTFIPSTVITLLFCIVFFIVIPCVIYYLSYIPYYRAPGSQSNLEVLMRNQEYMYNYHSGLTARHPYESPWYTWPLDIRPTWFYSGAHDTPDGMTAGISTFGNPFVWWGALIGTLTVIIRKIFRRDKKYVSLALLIGLGSQFLPWTLVTRATFIYHYFASIPFILLLAVYAAASFIDKPDGTVRRGRSIALWVYIGLCAALFVLFYPVITGTPLSYAWLGFCKWFPSWVLAI